MSQFHLSLSLSLSLSFSDQFLVEGIPVQDFFHHEKENYSQEKELEKARKQLARGQTPQSNLRRLEMSSKTPGRQQTNLGKEVNREKLNQFPFFSFFSRRRSNLGHHFDRSVLCINVNRKNIHFFLYLLMGINKYLNFGCRCLFFSFHFVMTTMSLMSIECR